MARTVEYDFSAKGADETLGKLRSLNGEFRQGKINLEQYGGAKRDARRDSRAFSDTFRLEQQLWLSAHPNVERLTRAMSVFSSIMHTALAIQNALNLAMLVTQGAAASLADSEENLAQARREAAIALQTYGEGSVEYAEAMGKVRVAEAKNTDETNRAKEAENSRWTAIITGLGLVIPTAVSAAVTVAAHWAGVTGAFSGAAAAVSGFGGFMALLAPVLLIGAILAGVILAVIGAIALAFYLILTPGDQVEQFLKRLFPWWAQSIQNIGLTMKEFFEVTLPNLFINFVNHWIHVVEQFVNTFVTGVNHIISAYNRLAGILGLSKLSLIATLSLPDIPTLNYRGQVTAGGSQLGAYGTNSSAGSYSTATTGGNTIIINNAGNMITENEVFSQLDTQRIRNLRDRGVRG